MRIKYLRYTSTVMLAKSTLISLSLLGPAEAGPFLGLTSMCAV